MGWLIAVVRKKNKKDEAALENKKVYTYLFKQGKGKSETPRIE